MSRAVVRGGFDTFANSAKPSMEYHGAKYLRLLSGAEEIFIYMRVPAPRGVTVSSVRLRLFARGASSGSRTLTASRIAEVWKHRQLNWNNRPSLRANPVTAPIGTLADGDAVEFDLTAHAQTIVNGAQNYGWKITTSATTEHRFYGFDSGDFVPHLVVEWDDAPDAPTSLSPSGSTVSSGTPTLQFDYTDVSGDTDLAAVRVQIDAAKNTTNPAFDTGRFATTEPELALTGSFVRTQAVTTTSASTAITSTTGFATADIGEKITGTGIPANATIASIGATVYNATADEYRATTATLSAAATASGSPTATITRTYNGLGEGASTSWRVRVQDGGGLWSDWSDWSTFKKVGLAALTITNPAASPNNFVTEHTPPILWTFTGQTMARVFIYKASDLSTELYDSGKKPLTNGSLTLPKGILKDERTYTVKVRAWDGLADRERTPGAPLYAEATRDFTVNAGATLAVTGTTATQVGITPWVDVTWSRSTAPDSWSMRRTNVATGVAKIIETDILPADTLVSGTSYTWRDYTACPHTAYTYHIIAVVNGVKSPNGPTSATVTTYPEGIWIVDFDRNINVTLFGDDTGTWDLVDTASTYKPVGSSETIRVVTGMSGLEGSLTGVLSDGFNKTFAAMEADLYSIKEKPTQTVRIIAGDMNIRAVLGDIKVSPSPRTRQGQRVKDVSFNFWQRGDLPFTPIGP